MHSGSILAQAQLARVCSNHLDVMSDGEEEFFVPPVAASSDTAGDEECFVRPAEPLVKTRAVGRQGRPRPPSTSAAFGSWISVQASSGSSASSSEPFLTDRVLTSVVGFGELLWEYIPSAIDTGAAAVGGPGGEGARCAVTCGDISYCLKRLWTLTEPWEVPFDFDVSSIVCPLRLSLLLQDHVVDGVGVTVKEFEALGEVQCNRMVTLLATTYASLMGSPLPSHIWSVPVGLTVHWNSLVRDCPPQSYVKRWRRESGIARRGPTLAAPPEMPIVANVGPLLALPCKRGRPSDVNDAEDPIDPSPAEVAKRRKRDPMIMITAASFSLKLRQVAEYSDALDDAAVILGVDVEAEVPPERDRSHDLRRTELRAIIAKLGSVGMLIERRLFAQEFADDSVLPIQCFSDASPVVGAELEGMIVEIHHRDKTIRKITLPGSSLNYGHFDSINKSIVFCVGCVFDCRAVAETHGLFCQ